MKRFGWIIVGILALSGLGSSGLARADVIAVQYDFTGVVSGGTSAPPSLQTPPYTATDLTRGAGILTNSGTATGTFAGTRFDGSQSEANAVTNNDYFTFTVSAGTGNALNLTSFSYAAQRSSTGPDTTFIRSSLDNFSTTLASGTLPSTSFINVAGTLDPSFQSTTVPVEFRIYFYGAAANPGASGRATLDNVTINAVPEPSTVALMMMGLAAIGFAAWKKRIQESKNRTAGLMTA